jgi:NAD(P)-dependent dehydrogenase (short-subunit alcohol dehydrogenase family)
MQINGTSAIVTGGASGLGAATVLRLAKAGAHVVALDRNAEAGKALAAAHAPDVTFVDADVTSEEEVQAAVDAAVAQAPLRIVVNCAGIAIPPQRTVGRGGIPHDLAAFRKVVEVNLIGTFNVTRLAAAAMPAPSAAHEERGVVVNTASLAAEDGQTGQVGYAASKAAVAGMTLPLARDLGVLGIRVNTILPGSFDTPIFGPTNPQVEEFQRRLLADAVFPNRLGDPDEFAALAEHIITNPYLNAETIRLDAGTRMRAKP